VNVASRIESSCRAIHYPIVVSRRTSESARDLAILPAGRIGIRGRSERMDVDIVVGDAEVAGSPSFETLAQCHSELLSMIETGSGDLASSEPIRKALAQCAQIAVQIDPDLVGFYQVIPARIDDFSRSQPGAETVIEV
jgi:adenylate cyclase